ncbi:S1/P1 nuclease [Azospirillum palustre]
MGKLTCLFAALVACASWANDAAAWGRDGHETVAAIAYSLLTPETKQKVDVILGDTSGAAFIKASTWADEIKGIRQDKPYPTSGPWHYVSIPLESPVYVQNRDCKSTDCVVEKINEFRAKAADTSLLPAIRRDALAFVIHFVGDVHQPLHATENGDRGGNEVAISFRGRQTNLHSIWDSGIIKASWGSIDSHRTDLIAMAPDAIHRWARGTPADWATESHAMGRDVVHPSIRGGNSSKPIPFGPVTTPIVLPDDYATKMLPTVDAQIVKAGIRLAMILNQDLGRN